MLLQVVVDRAFIDAPFVNIAVRNWLKLGEQQSGVSARSQSPAFASRMREEVFVASGAIADLVDSRYPSIDVVSVCSLWPCLMDDWDPQIAFMTAVRHVGPGAQREVRDDVVCGRVSRRLFLRWSIEFLFSRLASLACPRLFVLRIGRLTGEASSNSLWSDPLQVEDIALSYAFLRATSKNETSFKTAYARPMFQR